MGVWLEVCRRAQSRIYLDHEGELMPRDRRFLSGLLLSVLLAGTAAAQSTGVHWQHDIETAKATAAQTGRLVLVHVWADNCGPCLALEQNVFNQPGVGGALEAKFVPVKLNANEYPAIAQWYGINRVPTDLILAPDGELIGKMISPATPAAYLAELGQVANQYASQSGQAFQAAVAAAPQPKILNPAYANLPVGIGAPKQTPAESTQNATTNPYAAVGALADGRYAMAGMPSASMSAANGPYSSPGTSAPVPSVTVPPFAGQVPAPSPPAVSPSNAADDRYAQSVATPPAAVTNQFAVTPQLAAPATPTTPSVSNPPAVEATTQSPIVPDARQLPQGAPPLGFDGYCAVSMRTSWKWVAGDPKWGAIHRGRTYWFVSPQEQQQFLANPDYYAPALAGMDPVFAIDHQQSVAGVREHSLDYDNQFYLFSSEATLEQFTANPERYATGVRQAMGMPAGSVVAPSRR
jgi:protein disulfide-isomerase